jgi:hypothetical protein
MDPVIDEMSEGIIINAGVDGETCDSDTTASCDWNSGNEEEMNGTELL